MKITFWILCLLSIFLVCACVYEVPLVEEDVLSVDPQLAGIWQEIPEEGEAEDLDDRLIILPFSETEYVAILSPGDGGLYFRAYPIRVGDMTLIQLEWLGVDPEEGERYHVCQYMLQNGVLTVETLNDDVISDEIKDSAALRAALLENRDNPELFDEPDRYRRVED